MWREVESEPGRARTDFQGAAKFAVRKDLADGVQLLRVKQLTNRRFEAPGNVIPSDAVILVGFPKFLATRNHLVAACVRQAGLAE
jgi:hypothetical protein